jgi:hypothetical protein
MRIHYLDQNPNLFLISSTAEARVPLAANIPTLYALEDHVPLSDLANEGTTLVIGKQNLATPLGLECFKHTIYLNTVHHAYPRISSKAPPTDGSIKPEDFEHHLNSMKNLPVFHRLNHVAVLASAAAESPALIIQPGPSLDFEFIRSVAERCVTIAIGRVLPQLLEQDIVPDVVYQQDTSRNSWEVSYGVLKGRRLDAILIANPVGYIHEYISCFSRVYKSWNYFPFEVDRFPHAIDSIAPSTTTGAFSLALHLKCNPIIFHGGDFGIPLPAAPPDPGINFSGIIEEDGVYIFRPIPHLVLSIAVAKPDGTGVKTSPDYLSASQWIKRTALSLKETAPRVQIYDQSSTGMLTVSSVIAPFRPEVLAGRTRHLEPREYDAPFHWVDFVRELVRRYTNIRRILNSTGRTPELSLVNPYNSIYTGLRGFSTKPFTLSPKEVAIAVARADEVLEVLQRILAEAAGS